MTNKEMIKLKNTLEIIHKDICNVYSKHPNDKEIKRIAINIGDLKEKINEKIEAPCVQDNASN